MRLKDLVGKMAIRTAEPFSTEPPSGIVTGFGLFGKPTVFRFNQKYMDEPVKIVNVTDPGKASGFGYMSHFATCEYAQRFRRKKK